MVFADPESDEGGSPSLLPNDKIQEQVRQSREKLADQAHPHEDRARRIFNDQAREDMAAAGNIEGITAPKRSHVRFREVAASDEPSKRQREEYREERLSHGSRNAWFGNDSHMNQYERNDEGSGFNSDSETESRLGEAESCPYGCRYKSSDTWLIKAHLTQCPNKSIMSHKGEVSTNVQDQFAKHMIMSHTREVKAMVDDNLNILSKARFWPMPASSQALYAAMPAKAEPVRYNYNYDEAGLTVNNFKVVLKLHDRLNTSLSLNMFTNAALAKHETNRSWKIGKDATSMLVNDEFPEIKKQQEAMEALNNFRVIISQIWPLDGSVETLWNVVWKQMLSTAYQPQVEDISELFAYWLQDRAKAAMESRPPITFFHLQSIMSNICQRRLPVHNTEGLFREQKTGKEEALAKKNRLFKKGYRPYANPGNFRENKTRIVRQVDDCTCRKYNSMSGCSHQVASGGACVTPYGRWMHLCNFLDNSTGKLCLKPHPVTEHR